MEDGGKSTVTAVKAHEMPKQNTNGLIAAQQKLDNTSIPVPTSTRPALSSHHSNSMPTTPYVHARKLSDEYRTPSPVTRGQDGTSPRSSRSESDSTARSAGRPPYFAGCKYETSMALSRRRVPYSVGGEVLEPSSKVKKSLDPADEEKLSGDMRELYDRILPSADSDMRRSKLVAKLEKILNDKWPDSHVKVHVFGSSGNLLCSNDSDVDICITTPMKALERMCLLAKTLAEHGMQRIVCVPNAKVPIVKIWDPDLQLACDMNVNNTLALENTRMIRTYVQVDPRVRPLAMVIKHWTRQRILNDAALGGTLSSYTWICLIINFLQTRKPKILPNLQARPHQHLRDENGKLSSFADDLASLQGFGKSNKETLGELLFQFFRRYGHELDYEKHVISVREGGLISKVTKSWQFMQNNRLCVEEPFNTDRNLGNTADDISFRGVHLELRRAFDLVSQGKLTEACEPYEFPPQEEKIFVKPTPQPRPVLTRSLSQQGRRNHNNIQNPNPRNAGGHKNRTGNSNRRASSAAAMNKLPAFPPAPQAGPPPGERGLSGDQIHNQLFQHYQLLQAQEAQLRMQMHQRQQANLHAQVTAQLPPLHMPLSAYPQQGGFEAGRRQSNVEPGPLSAPLRSIQHGLYYPIPTMSPSQSSSRSPQMTTPSQSTTNPPSPSLSISQPLNGEPRRSMQRSLTTDNLTAAARSHSQPPSNSNNGRFGPRVGRNLPPHQYHPTMQGGALPYMSLHQYQQAYFQAKRPGDIQHIQNIQASQMSSTSESPRMRPLMMDGSEEVFIPRQQYVGYYVDPSIQQRHDRENLMPIPAYHDLANRARRASASPNLSRLRSHPSRSPSPSHSTTTHDQGGASNQVRSRDSSLAGSSSISQAPSTRPSDAHAVPRTGPVIVDGSSDASEYATPPESLYFAMGQSEAASLSDEQACDTPSTASVATAQDQAETFALEPPAGYRLATSMPNILQFGDFPARPTGRTLRSTQADEKQPSENTTPTAAPAARTTFSEQSSGLGIDFTAAAAHELEKPANGQPVEVRRPADINHKASPPKQEPPHIPPPLLSPVREVRTPSPTATRNNSTMSVDTKVASHGRSGSLASREMVSSPLAQSSKSGKGKEKLEELEAPAGKPPAVNGTEASQVRSPQIQSKPFAETKSPSSPVKAVPSQTSGWQQSTGKKKKTRKASSVGSAALMQQQGERKGG